MTIAILTKKLPIATFAAVALMGALAPESHALVLGEYLFDGNTLAASSVDPNLTFQNLAAGAGLNVTGTGLGFVTGNPATGDAYNASGWNNAEATDYFEFTLDANNGWLTALGSITFDARRSGTGPSTIRVRSSQDSFGTDLGSFTVGTAFGASPFNLALNFADFNSLANPVTFRFFGDGASAAAGTLRLDNVVVNGSVGEVPTPALLPGLLGLGVTVWRKRQADATTDEA